MTKEELSARYPDADWRERWLQLSDLRTLLSDCIIRKGYKISDDINNAIALTTYGKRIQLELQKQQVPVKEARLTCFLFLAHVDVLVDVMATDMRALRAAIGKQIAKGDLLFPFILGRELYDRAAQLFEDERPSLDVAETLQLLQGTPQGVFQLGDTLIGPFGLLASRGRRRFEPSTRVRLYSCADMTCTQVHATQLATDYEAPINEHRHKMYPLLEKESREPSAWTSFTLDLAGLAKMSFDDKSTLALPFFPGDCLVDAELVALAAALVDTTSGRFRQDLKQVGMSGNLPERFKTLSRAQLMQVVLLCTDEEIIRALDGAVAASTIHVPAGEVRSTVINRYASGTFCVDVQLSRFGARLRPARKELAALRLRRLVGMLYQMNEDADISELDWQLRGVEAGGIEARLEEFLRTSTPDQVLRRLVLARRTNMIAACTEVGVDEHVERSDDDLVSALLWKLGFDAQRGYLGTERFWELHNGMVQMTSTAGVSALVDSEMIRGLASNYFVELERILDDSLAFCTWALLTDHVASHSPFRYRVDDERLRSFSRLSDHAVERGFADVSLGDKNTLHPLCRGFAVLADLVEKLESEAVSHSREVNDYPEFAQYTQLKSFPFKHTVAFLDLSLEARARLTETLKTVGRDLLDSRAPELRNEQLHFRRTATDLERLSAGLRRVGSAIHRLESAGLARINFRLVDQQGDEWGRKTFVLADSRNRRIAFARPTPFDWIGLPPLNVEQHLLTEATFAEPNEMLRFTSVPSSKYADEWSDFPLRRRRSETIAPVEVSTSSGRGAVGSVQSVQPVGR